MFIQSIYDKYYYLYLFLLYKRLVYVVLMQYIDDNFNRVRLFYKFLMINFSFVYVYVYRGF